MPKSSGNALPFTTINCNQYIKKSNLILHEAWPHLLSVLHLRRVQRGNRGFQGLFPAYYLIMMNEQPWKWQLFGCFVCIEASICNFPRKMSIWLWEQGAKLLLASLGQVVKRVNDMYCQENLWYTKEKQVGKIKKKGFWKKSSPCWPRLPLFFSKNTLKIIIFYNTKFYFNIFQKV